MELHEIPAAFQSRLRLAVVAALMTGPKDFTTLTKLTEARQLLQDGVQEMDIVMNVGRFKNREYGYVNDEAYARGMAEKGMREGKGSARIMTELKKRGIDPELAKEAAASDSGSERQRALAEAEKILLKAGGLPPLSEEDEESTEASRAARREAFGARQKILAKVSRRLSALGYGASVIYSVIEEINR